jgi:hypothetical protein
VFGGRGRRLIDSPRAVTPLGSTVLALTDKDRRVVAPSGVPDSRQFLTPWNGLTLDRIESWLADYELNDWSVRFGSRPNGV